MRLLFKQRFFSWFDSYDIYDDKGKAIFTVKGQLSWGHCLNIYDTNENYIGKVKEELFSIPHKFHMYVGEQMVGEITKELTFFRPKFSLDCNGWEVNGNFLEWDYKVTDPSGRNIMVASKQWMNFTDTYVMDIGEEEDALYCLMIVLAIDAAKCSQS